ncbi:alanine-phosphoribitol ligase [Streptomyces sp. Ru71]|uniref:styrene monooxygenase/indole monooxygenase family protein n=1 Tax=Streptomyces sp. Ru71 TaxID=2080746 RepID=UPI000CDD0D53|nr:styrene monooxygenase/indole monooxygenase family protein [Streptomyces sp. Ru71]POX48178.1 alanine-phosphoribitol ligase [Streptomyces sp. Ru71]
MRKITIIGAGQAGLQLGIGLLGHGYDVTVVSNRTGQQIRDGRVMSSQCMFGTALGHERNLGLNLWEAECPPVEGISFCVPDGAGGKAVDWSSRLDASARSVDQRVKMPAWLEEFERRGGKVELHDAGVDDLELYARESDLVIVAAGKGEIARLFERDAERSTFDAPQRALALTYVRGMKPRDEHSAVSFNLLPGIGEYFTFPALTTTGACDIMVFEGVPGGPLDCWQDVSSPEQHLERSLEIVRRYLPWEAERCTDLELTDANGVLAGRFPPTVRKPVGRLPSGATVLGVADVVLLNDPITGQGSNNASKCAASYLSSILEHGDRPFDTAFMQETFERYWDYAQYVATWTNALLGAPPEHVLKLLSAASDSPRIARRFANGFDDPRDFFHWFMNPTAAESYLAAVQA